MPPPTLTSPRPRTIITRPFSQSSFHPYGSAIISPIPASINDAPTNTTALSGQPVVPVVANQGSAVKYSPIAPMQNTYGNGESRRAGSPRMSMFSCFPRTLRTGSDHKGDRDASELFDVRILERHPHTSQTFIPLSYGHNNGDSDGEKPVYLVIVAPTLSGQSVEAVVESQGRNGARKTVRVHDPPDLNNLQAFLARPGQAVTYAAGTWHAPMVVLGKKRIDFLVVQFVNGIDDEDCQEVVFGEGLAVEVDTSAETQGSGREKAKL